MTTIRIALIDDHAVVRYGLRVALQLEADVEVVGEGATAREAIQQASALQPDVMLLDLKMPEMSGAEAARAIKQASPRTRVLIVSGVDEGAEIVAALQSDVDGYVLKGIQPAELVQAIRVIARGQAYIQPEVAKRLLNTLAASAQPMPPPPQLTQRELEVLRLLATNNSNKDIAAALNISEETVRSHIKHLLQKLDQPNRAQAVLAAVRLKLINLQ